MASPKLSNGRIAASCLLAAGVMLGAAFAAKPMYDTFCRVTGFGGTTRVAASASDTVLDRTIEIRFDSNVSHDLPVRFKPDQAKIDVKVGETTLAYFTMTNEASVAVDAIASYNVTPHKAGPYFTKLECFCFTETRLEPGETIEMPVVFYVDPLLVEDGLDDVNTITLSYTYFRAKDADAARAAAASKGSGAKG